MKGDDVMPGDWVRLTFREHHVGYLVGSLAIIEDIFSIYGIDSVRVLVTTGPGCGQRVNVTLEDISELS